LRPLPQDVGDGRSPDHIIPCQRCIIDDTESTLFMIQHDILSSSANQDLWLEVRRGRTRAPHRAVRTRRFLIGAGSNCQLQLGGDDVPILHSILLVDEDGAQIDTVVPSPELFVNGVPQRGAELRDGDVLTIGRFEFAVHIQQPVDADAGDDATRQNDAPDVESTADLSELSAAAIVSHLERELHEIARLQTSRETGAEALLQAARRFAGELADDESASAEEAVLLQLQQLSRTLQRSVDDALDRRDVGRDVGDEQRHSGLSVAVGAPYPALATTTHDPGTHRKAS
jgi:Inner membrane component of T3SS, cytoplasmic domain